MWLSFLLGQGIKVTPEHGVEEELAEGLGHDVVNVRPDQSHDLVWEVPCVHSRSHLSKGLVHVSLRRGDHDISFWIPNDVRGDTHGAPS